MSVLIRGIETPTSCARCPMLEGDRMDGLCHAASKWLDDDEHWTWYVYPEGDMDDSKPCNCPLVPIPGGDVQPVVRATWRRYSPFTDTYECSNCGEQVIDQQFRTNFCPNCGADMREES